MLLAGFLVAVLGGLLAGSAGAWRAARMRPADALRRVERAARPSTRDTATGDEVISLLAGLAAAHGATVVVATHDAGLAALAPKRVSMRDGRVAVAAAA